MLGELFLMVAIASCDRGHEPRRLPRAQAISP